MNYKEKYEYFKSWGCLAFEAEELASIVKNLESSWLSRFLAERNALKLNYDEGRWNRKRYLAAIEDQYYFAGAYVIDTAGDRHADVRKLIEFYKENKAIDKELMDNISKNPALIKLNPQIKEYITPEVKASLSDEDVPNLVPSKDGIE